MSTLAYLLSCGGTILAFFIPILIYLFYRYVFGAFTHFKSGKYKLPGPTPKVFFGNYKELSRLPGGCAGLEAQRSLAKRYGPICSYYIGYTPYVMVSDPDAVKEVLIQKFDCFRNRGVRNQILPFGRDPDTPTIITAKGDTWKGLRHVLTPAFSAKKLKLIEDHGKVPFQRFVNRVKAVANTEQSINIMEWVNELILEIHFSVFFSRSVLLQVEGGEGNALRDNVNRAFGATKKGGAVDVFRSRVLLSNFPCAVPLMHYFAANSAAGKSMRKAANAAYKIAKERRASKELFTDILQLIVDAEPKLSDDEVAAQVVSLLFAGNETATNALTFIIYALATNPAIQDKLANHIIDYFEENPDANLYDSLNELPYLENVINETLRIYPPFTKVSRVCEKECEIGGHLIPPGVHIDIPVYYIHHNPDLWEEPEKFNPDRFSSASEGRHPMSFLPFSDGPRSCLGKRFAMMEMKMVLIELLKEFRVIQTSDTEVPISTHLGITLGPKDRVMLGFVARD